MKIIELNKGQVAKVCDCHYELVAGYKWYFQSNSRGGYAYRNVWSGSKSITILMHKLINTTPKGLDTDHINMDKLDNRCSNLRSLTHKQNSLNIGLKKNNRSGYTGVSWDKRSSKWRAYITISGKQSHLGLFNNLEHAITAREMMKIGRFI